MEKPFPARTLLKLLLRDLFPQHILETLHQQFGERFELLYDFEQVIITTATIERWVNHGRACQLTTKHPREVTLTLPRLESKGFLTAGGEQKNKHYTLPGASVMTPEEVFSQGALNVLSSSTHYGESSTHYGQRSTHSEDCLTQNDTTPDIAAMSESDLEDNHQSIVRDEHGRLLNRFIDLPYIDAIDNLTQSFRDIPFTQAAVSRKKLHLWDKKLMNKVILKVCQGHFISVSALGEILNRNPNALRQQYLKPLVEHGQLKLAFPQYKNHSKQGYSAV